MKKISDSTKNLLRLKGYEHIRTLQTVEGAENVFKKQIRINHTIEELIFTANHCPKGVVEVVFAGKGFNKTTEAEEIILDSDNIISFFNTDKREGLMFRTVIVVDMYWSDDFKVFQCEFGLSNKYLKKYESTSKKV
jgi:hypothetical protein